MSQPALDRPDRNLAPYLAMLAGAAAFTIMGACAHGLRSRCDWQVAMIARSAIPLLLATGMALSAKAKLVLFGPWNLWMRSIAGSLSMMGAFFAFTHLPISQVLTLTNLYPIWVAVLSWPFLGKAPSLDVWLAAAIGVTGVVLIEQPEGDGTGYASMAALSSSLMSGFAMIGLHRLKQIDPRAIVAHFSLVSLLTALGALAVFDHSIALDGLADPISVLLLAGVGLSATIGQFLLTLAFTHGSPARVAVVGLVQVAFGMACDVLLWGQPIGAWTMAGTALVIGPTAWVMLRK